jgi:hypothetical protein
MLPGHTPTLTFLRKRGREGWGYGVTCQHCAGTIVLAPDEQLATELSLPCPQCGRRAVYDRRSVFQDDGFED